MKKILFLTLSSILFSPTYSQIEITLEGQTSNLSGLTHFVHTNNESEQEMVFLIHNLSSQAQSWVITRKRVNVATPSWVDHLDWGEEGNPLNEIGYAPQPTDPWTTPQTIVIPANTNGRLKVYVDPDLSVSQYAHYRYYLGNDADLLIDSVDVIFNETATINGVANPIVWNVYPNPTSNYLRIDSESSEENVLSILDVFGNLICEEKFIQSKELNMGLYEDGIYLIMIIDASGLKTSKLIVVNH